MNLVTISKLIALLIVTSAIAWSITCFIQHNMFPQVFLMQQKCSRNIISLSLIYIIFGAWEYFKLRRQSWITDVQIKGKKKLFSVILRLALLIAGVFFLSINLDSRNMIHEYLQVLVLCVFVAGYFSAMRSLRTEVIVGERFGRMVL